MKMENDTHGHSKTTTRKITALYLLWVLCFFFFAFLNLFLFVNFCSLFLSQGVHSLLRITSIEAGLRGQGEGLLREDQSVTFQLQG